VEVIILAGGFGTRLRSVLPNVPKPMAPIGEKPFLQILLEKLSEEKVKKVILSLHFMAGKIQDYFGSNFLGMEIECLVEKTPLGTGGAIRLCLENCKEEKVFVFNGDTYLDIDLKDLTRLWDQRQCPILVGRHVDDLSRYGALEIKDGIVTGMSEKAGVGAGLINAGCYVLPRNIFDSFASRKTFSFEKDFLQNNLKEKGFAFYEAEGSFIDIGIPEDYVRAQALLS